MGELSKGLGVCLMSAALGCTSETPACETLTRECQPFEPLLEAVPEGVRADDWVAAATAAHERARAVIGKYFTGEVTVLRGVASAIDQDEGFSNAAVLASRAHVERSRHSPRKNMCQVALLSESTQQRTILEQPDAEPGVTYFSVVTSLQASGGMILSCSGCLPNLCELPLDDPIHIDVQVPGMKLDGSPAHLELRADLAPIDPWTLTQDDLRTVSSIYDSTDWHLLDHLDVCDDALGIDGGGRLWEELPIPPELEPLGFYACAREVYYRYAMYVDRSCPDIYGIRDLSLTQPQRCCWYFDCIECSEHCEPVE